MAHYARFLRRLPVILAVFLLVSLSHDTLAQCPAGYLGSVDLGTSTLYNYPATRGLPNIGQIVWPYCIDAGPSETVTTTSFAVPVCMQIAETGTWSGAATWPQLTPGGGNPELGTDATTAITGVHFKETQGPGMDGQFYVAASGDYISSPTDVGISTIDGVVSSLTIGPDPGCRQIESQLPVELTSFNVIRDGMHASVVWETATENSSAGFGVEVSREGGPFEEYGYLAGAGTSVEPRRYSFDVTLESPGRYVFRLAQTDTDGTVTFGPETEIVVDLVSRYDLGEAYPNPFNPTTTLSLSVAREQLVRATLHDALGREVRRIMDQTLASGASHQIHIDASGLPSGTYLLRIVGEAFVADRNLVLMK